MGSSRIKTLILHADYTTLLSYYDDWLGAFQGAPDFDVEAINIRGGGNAVALKTKLREVDLTILLHSTNADAIYAEPLAAHLQARRGLLVSFVGNEVNLPSAPIAAKRTFFAQIEPDFIATQLLAEAGEHLFGDLVRRRVVALPHALNPDIFRPETPPEARRIDIGVRAARYLPHLGDDDRNRLHDFFGDGRFDPPLVVDIGLERFDRAGWAAFLNRCRGTVSSEAGSWFLERDDAAMKAIRAWAMATQSDGGMVISSDSLIGRIGRKLPTKIRAAMRNVLRRGPVRHEAVIAENLPFDEVYDRFFRDLPRPPVYGKCISSRHFDAIGTKTCQIMFAGRFNDILEADRHYIALAADFSNIDEVLRRFRDDASRRAIVDAAFDHAMSAHTYHHRVQALAAAVRET
jgi:hypothetical protein